MADKPEQAFLPFGDALRVRRGAARLTQGELGERVGTDQSTVAKWEKRAVAIKDHVYLGRLASALGATVEELTSGMVPRSMLRLELGDSEMLDPESEGFLADVRVNMRTIADLDEDEARLLAEQIRQRRRKLERDKGIGS